MSDLSYHIEVSSEMLIQAMRVLVASIEGYERQGFRLKDVSINRSIISNDFVITANMEINYDKSSNAV